MPEPKLPGGPTQDEIMAVSLFKLGLCPTDTVLEIGCGTGKVSVAMAKLAKKVFALDKRPEAISVATETARQAGSPISNFPASDAVDFLKNDQVVRLCISWRYEKPCGDPSGPGKKGEADHRHQRGDGEHA